MVRQLAGDIGEKLMEQGQHTGQAFKQAPKTIFQGMVGERTDEEKKQSNDKAESGIEDLTSGSSSSQQQPMTQTDLRRQELELEKQAKYKKMQKILHRKLFDEAEKVRRRKEEEERLRVMQEEEEKKKKQEVQVHQLEEQRKEEALAVKVAQRAKGAGEFGPKKPK